MSEIMITGNELIDKDTINSFTSILEKNIEVKQGFGFLNTAIVDQHFVKRKRHNRLISIILENPKLLGIAIDEATSIIVYPDNSFEVLGESQVLVLDAANASTIKTDKNGNLSASELKMHLLVNGDKFSIPKRKVVR
jgi:cyanophycinase